MMKLIINVIFLLFISSTAFAFKADDRDKDLYDGLQKLYDIESKDPFWKGKPYPINFTILYNALTKNKEKFPKQEINLFLYWAYIVDIEDWSHTGAEVDKLIQSVFIKNHKLFIEFLHSRSHLTSSMCRILSESFYITHYPSELSDKARNQFLVKYGYLFKNGLTNTQSKICLSKFKTS